jgi:hypothetical protein
VVLSSEQSGECSKEVCQSPDGKSKEINNPNVNVLESVEPHERKCRLNSLEWIVILFLKNGGH